MKRLLTLLAFVPLIATAQPIPGTGGASGGGAIQYDEDTPHVSGDKLNLSGAVRRDTAASSSGADGDRSTINVDALGRLWVNGSDVTQPVSGSITCNAGTNLNTSALATSANQSTMIGHVDGVEGLLTTIDADTGSIATSASSIDGKITACNTGAVVVSSSALPSGAATSALQTTGNTSLATIAGAVSGTEMQVDVLTMPTTAVTQSGTWTVQPGNTANSTPWLVSSRPATSGGLSIARFLDLDEADQEIKGSAGQLYGYFIFNAGASTRYFKLYNLTAASTTVGTSTPVLTIPLPAGAAANVEFSHGIAFSTAITAACTTGIADADTGAPGANECIANFFYN